MSRTLQPHDRASLAMTQYLRASAEEWTYSTARPLLSRGLQIYVQQQVLRRTSSPRLASDPTIDTRNLPDRRIWRFRALDERPGLRHGPRMPLPAHLRIRPAQELDCS